MSAYEGNPALVPLRHFTGQMILLHEDGSASYLAADGSA